MAFYFLRHPNRPLVVVFSPKCASQSLRRWFTDTLDDPDWLPKKTDAFHIAPRALATLEDHHKVFVLRDPLHRLVSFYSLLVVSNPRNWCFADAARRFRLHDKSFRQFLFVLDHLHRHALAFQHHLEPQLLRAQGVVFDEILTVEGLDEGIEGLNRRFGFQAKIKRHNSRNYDSRKLEPVGDRSPDWLRRHGLPPRDYFFDSESRTLAEAIYAEDLAAYRNALGNPSEISPSPAQNDEALGELKEEARS